jgi:hypothetical protein
MKQNYLLSFCLLITFLAYSHERVIIHGIIKVDEAPVEGVYILNLVTEKSAISNTFGKFKLEVSEDDLIVFSAVNLNYWRRSIREVDIKKGYIEIKMTPKEEKLQEVVVAEYTKINAQDLRIIDYKPKVYTPAERRLRTAEKFRWYSPLLIPLVGMSVDGLINEISGRTAMLKKEVQVEIKEKRFQKLSYLYKEEYFGQTLKIPAEYVSGFQYYAINDEELVALMEANQKSAMEFRLATLSTEFLNYLQLDE